MGFIILIIYTPRNLLPINTITFFFFFFARAEAEKQSLPPNVTLPTVADTAQSFLNILAGCQSFSRPLAHIL